VQSSTLKTAVHSEIIGHSGATLIIALTVVLTTAVGLIADRVTFFGF
jgi:hypothetical protein